MMTKLFFKKLGKVSERISDILFLALVVVIAYALLYVLENRTFNGNLFEGIEVGYLFPMLATTRLSALVLSDADEKRAFADSCVDISAMLYIASIIADLFGFYLFGISMMFVMIVVIFLAAVAKPLNIAYKKIKRSV